MLLGALHGTSAKAKAQASTYLQAGAAELLRLRDLLAQRKRSRQPMPDNTSGAWDLIAVPWHLDEHIPDFPVPAGTAATISPPLPEKGDGEAGGAAPGRMTVLHHAIADAVAEAARPLLLAGALGTRLSWPAGDTSAATS